MTLLTETEVLRRASVRMDSVSKSADRILAEAAAPDAEFDVFLSHSSAEPAEILLGIFQLLTDQGLSVYVDCYGDPQLSPDEVTPATAAILRNRLRRSRSLLYVHSRHSKKSRWMPWELGFFDGYRGLVGIIPVVRNEEDTFAGEEFLGLYPYVDRAPIKGRINEIFWINRSPRYYAQLKPWIRDGQEIRAHS